MIDRTGSISKKLEETEDSKESQPLINPFSGATQSGGGDDRIQIASFRREERELFEMAMIRAGLLKKKAINLLGKY